VYADAQLSEDTARRGENPGPKGCHGAAATQQRAPRLGSHASAAPRTTTCRPHRDNAGYAETTIRL
jgi:hypothetical protein